MIINDAAKTFLNILHESASFAHVATAIGPQYNLTDKIDFALKATLRWKTKILQSR